MVAGVTPGLQNRRAASSMSPVCSTHTRFRHLFSVVYANFLPYQSENLVLQAACGDKNVISAKGTTRPAAREISVIRPSRVEHPPN